MGMARRWFSPGGVFGEEVTVLAVNDKLKVFVNRCAVGGTCALLAAAPAMAQEGGGGGGADLSSLYSGLSGNATTYVSAALGVIAVIFGAQWGIKIIKRMFKLA